MNNNIAVLLACLLGCGIGQALAERPESFHGDVEKLIVYQEPVILLDNVRLVDGTGAPSDASWRRWRLRAGAQSGVWRRSLLVGEFG